MRWVCEKGEYLKQDAVIERSPDAGFLQSETPEGKNGRHIGGLSELDASKLHEADTFHYISRLLALQCQLLWDTILRCMWGHG